MANHSSILAWKIAWTEEPDGLKESMGSNPVSGRYPGEGNGNQLQYSCLGNPKDREAWWVTVHGITKESDMTEQLHMVTWSMQ